MGNRTESKLDDRRERERRMLEEEWEWLGAGKKAPASPHALWALCLSGGGIRSASFSLGVLQALAKTRMLGQFHYLSTVSGGGYIGSWLSMWITREGHESVLTKLSTPNEPEPAPVRNLRSYTSYLSPVSGFSTDFLTLVGIFVRNLVVTWLMLMPIIAAALMFPRLVVAWNTSNFDAPEIYVAVLMAAAVLVLVAIAYIAADVPQEVAPEESSKDSPKESSKASSKEKTPPSLFGRLCFVPILAAATLLSGLLAWDRTRITESALQAIVGLPAGWLGWALAGGVLQLLAMLAGLGWRLRRGLAALRRPVLDAMASFTSGFVAGGLLFAAAKFLPDLAPPAYATLSVPSLLVVLWAGSTVYAVLTARIKGEDEREWWARASGWWLRAGVVWILAAVLVLYVPAWVLSLDVLKREHAPELAGAAVAAIGIATSLAGYLSRLGGKIRQHASGFLQAAGLRVLDLMSAAFVLALLTAINIAISVALDHTVVAGTASQLQHAQQAQQSPAGGAGLAASPGEQERSIPSRNAYARVLENTPLSTLAVGILALCMFSVVISWLAGVNTFSLHSMYGNRLTRAYLGASNSNRQAHRFTGFDRTDSRPLACWAEKAQSTRERRLFPVLNAALNLVEPAGDRLEWQQRKAASFTMTPLHCGSDVLGYAPTKEYGAKDNGISWARAMAISGAAASPNMGYHTSRLVAFVMTIFNARLGWWCPNPREENKRWWTLREPPIGLKPILDEAFARTTDKRGFVHLSDGGHFENLGLYEMVRRGCRRILVVDASCDAGDAFENLEGAIRKIRVDFGASITFADPLPTAENARARKRHIAVGKIDYLDGPAGVIVYMKPTLTGEEPEDVLRYAAANNRNGKAFPHQPTSDQSFDEAQFESYRMLGVSCTERHFKDASTWPGADLSFGTREGGRQGDGASPLLNSPKEHLTRSANEDA